MEATITIADGSARHTALMHALAAYNAGTGQQLAAPQYLAKLAEGQLDGLVASYLTTKIRPVDFLQRFTAQERAAIRTAAKTNPQVEDYLQMLAAVGNGELDLTHQLTIDGVQALEAAGLIAAGRAAQILAL